MKDVIISIRGVNDVGFDNDAVELVTGGQYSMENGVAEFSYEESELTGLQGTRTTFRVEPERLTMTRRGSVNSQMVFEEGRKHYFAYETPVGAITMAVDTHAVETRLGEHGGTVDIRYLVDLTGSVTRNEFHIGIREPGCEPEHRVGGGLAL